MTSPTQSGVNHETTTITRDFRSSPVKCSNLQSLTSSLTTKNNSFSTATKEATCEEKKHRDSHTFTCEDNRRKAFLCFNLLLLFLKRMNENVRQIMFLNEIGCFFMFLFTPVSPSTPSATSLSPSSILHFLFSPCSFAFNYYRSEIHQGDFLPSDVFRSIAFSSRSRNHPFLSSR